jgi:hypothetical protein
LFIAVVVYPGPQVRTPPRPIAPVFYLRIIVSGRDLGLINVGDWDAGDIVMDARQQKAKGKWQLSGQSICDSQPQGLGEVDRL